jgi:prolyl-tRNA synthetase
MKDAYSFDKDQAGLDKNYKAMYRAYQNILKRCGLKFFAIEADPGVMGGSVSHEFMVPAGSGEDLILSCPKCKMAKAFADKQESCPKCGVRLEKINCIEVGHIFQLGTKYSLSLSANFLNAQGKLQPVIMGCYGIGVSRLIPTIIEQHYDAQGIIWPCEISPYEVIILPLDVTDKKIMQKALDIYAEFKDSGIETLFDDRDERAGVKFKDADLVGIPVSIVIGQKTLENKKVELKTRAGKEVFFIDTENILKKTKDILRKGKG